MYRRTMINQGRFIHQSPTCGIDENRALLHRLERMPIQQMACLLRQRQMQ